MSVARSRPWAIWWWVGYAMTWIVYRLLWRVRFHERARIPPSGPLLYVANHQSYLDPNLVGAFVGRRRFTPMARASLFDGLLLGWALRKVGVIPLEQGRGDVAAVRAALGELAAGRCVLIFPEGGRTPDGILAPFLRGVMVLLKRSRATVVPVAVEGTFDAWPMGRSRPRLGGFLGVMAGEPIEAQVLLSMETDEALAHLRRTVEELRLELRRRLPKKGSGPF